MDQKIGNHFNGGSVEQYVGGNQTNNYYISMLQDSEREFVVTHNADIKPVSYFTGREMELQDLCQRIEEGRKSVLVSGMGGIGKTHICRKLFEEYINKHADGEDIPFYHIGYIEYNGDMDSSLMNCLKYRKQGNPEQNLEAAWEELKHLAADGKLLLFVDNVNVPVGEDAGLGRLKQIPGAVVLTSRRTSFSKEFEPYKIGFLSMEQCKKIYERIRYEDSGENVPEEDILDLEYIIENMAAGHTITVEFLAHLAYTKSWSVKRLHEELQSNGFRLQYKDEEDKLVNIQKSYEVLYDMSALTKAEQNILEAFSVFPYIPLSAETCNQWLLSDGGVSEDDDVLLSLYRKGWLQFDIEQGSITMHPVFAKFIYERCKPKLEGHRGLIEGCQKCLKIPKDGSALECQKYIPFAENILVKIDMEREMEQVQFMDVLAYLLRYIGGFQKAEVLYKKNLKIREKLYGEEHPDTAANYNNLVLLYKGQGKYREAEELCKKALQIREKIQGEEHPDTATSYNNLAGVYSAQGKYKEAEELYEKALWIREKMFGAEHSDTAASYNDLALLYENQGKYGEAEKLYEKALQIRTELLGEEHPDTATSYNNLAGVYGNLGKYKEAEKLYEKVLQISERVFGEEHPDTAASYNNLALLYESQGKYKKAEELHEKSLWISEKMFGEEHPDTATSYNNLAGAYRNHGRYREAEELYKKALWISEKLLGEEHPDTATSYSNLAVLYDSQGKYKEAEKLHEKALWIREKMLGEMHPHTAISYNNLAEVYEINGKYKEAQKLYEKALQIRKKTFGEEHPDIAASYNKLAGVHESQGKYKEAEELYKKALRIRERLLGEKHPDTAVSYNNLAGVHIEQGKIDMAIMYYYKAFKIFVFKLGKDHPNTQVVYKNMQGAYSDWNSDGNFEQWLEERMKESD